jgi:hypothetical protein
MYVYRALLETSEWRKASLLESMSNAYSKLITPIEGTFMDANHIRRSVVHLVVEIIEDLRDSEKKFTRISNPALGKKDGPSPMKKWLFFMNVDIFVNKKDNLPSNSP